MKADVAPFTLAPLLVAKPWGGNAIEPLLGLPIMDELIGEGWLCADLALTSPTGAGGGAMISRIEQGWGAGQALREMMDQHSEQILGRAEPTFPLLLKVLDASRHLSVQVHPSPAYAARVPGAHVKTEAWFSLAAAPEASFMVGVSGVERAEQLGELARQQAIGQAMHREIVEPGDAVWLPSGTVHALGAGCLVFEVQTASDTTFRLYDWTLETGLPARALHIEQSVEAADLSLQPLWSRARERGANSLVFETEAFGLYSLGAGRHALSGMRGSSGPVAVLFFAQEPGSSVETEKGLYEIPVGRVTVLPAAVAAGAVLSSAGARPVVTVFVR